MKIVVERYADSRLHFVAKNEDNIEAHLDADAQAGGEKKGMKPMELLLSAIASCSAMDLYVMLEKQNMPPDAFTITCEGTQKDNKEIGPFTDIHLEYILHGEVDEKRAQIAAKLSIEKYCSVAATLSPDVNITYTVKKVHGR
ncbi:hypothetical protein LSH36_1091g00235 [Paralvinella palmiformis]|uniref:Redox protein n=1 Tax=Paralvinella palmiformis TaxID=53620 RepID=A0AAD9IV53_9ANNE|nr:hypothetical protein LSH36_1091g00235 [Paralvinella palmiformis]